MMSGYPKTTSVYLRMIFLNMGISDTPIENEVYPSLISLSTERYSTYTSYYVHTLGIYSKGGRVFSRENPSSHDHLPLIGR